MVINETVEEVKVEKGIGIWGNHKCVQCGACCYEWHKFLHEIKARQTEQCENFEIRDGKAYCLAHEQKREPICENYFCGNTEFIARFPEKGDEKLRAIAEMLGTAPDSYKIPKLFPRLIKNLQLN